MTGTFDEWSKSEKLEKTGDIFEKRVTLPNVDEKIYYKVRQRQEQRVKLREGVGKGMGFGELSRAHRENKRHTPIESAFVVKICQVVEGAPVGWPRSRLLPLAKALHASIWQLAGDYLAFSR